MTAFSWIALMCAALPALLFLRNLRVFGAPAGHDNSTKVSILIPARDEEQNITAAVESALANGNAEVLVLDDGSNDRTYEIASEIATREPRLRVLRGEALPAGWVGKNFACAQLAAAARHRTLLFVDADVRLVPDAAARLSFALQESGAALVSGVPRQETVTFSEKLLVPLIHFLLLGFLPLGRMRNSSHTAYGTACGQLIMVERDAYETCGGHRAIRDRVHDGLALPKQFRASGCHTDLVDVTALATCRMYRRNGEVWRGLAKNTHEGFGAPARILPVTVLLGCGQILPFVLLFSGNWVAIAAAVLALLPRIVATHRFHQSAISVLLHPLAVLALLVIQWAGLVRYLRGRPAVWKGRAYQAFRASAGDRVPAAHA